MTLLTLLATLSSGQMPVFFAPPLPDERRAITATRVDAAPAIDGVLDDAAWESASPTSDFVQREPQQGAPATHRSVVKLVFDDRALYVSAELEQPGGLWAFNQRDMRRDFPLHESDSFSVILDTLGDGRNAFSFSVNPFGAQHDEQVIDESIFEANWDTVWNAATRRTDTGWTVELAIPWKSLRHGGPKTPWGIQFYRRERGMNEDTVWSPVPRSVTPWRMPYAGVVKGLEPAPSSLLALQLRPYVIGRLQRTGDGPFTFAPTAGGEVTWQPTESLTVDLTGNTDFAETDVDRRVVNLSRFSVFFPERRQFFLESAGIFASGIDGFVQPFFSRQIGLDPNGASVPISFGARSVYRTTEQSIGGMLVHTLPTADASPSLFGVARYSRNLGDQSRLGGMVVVRHDFEGVSGAETTNAVPVLDGLFRTGPVTLKASLMGSSTSTRAHTSTFGFTSTLEAEVQGSWGSVDAWALGVSPDFEARAGFVGRGNLLGAGLDASLDLRPSWLPGWIRNVGPWLSSSAFWQASTGLFQEANITLAPWWMQFRGGDELWVQVEHNEQELAAPFAPVRNVLFQPGHSRYQTYSLQGLSQASRKVAVQGSVGFGGYFEASTFQSSVQASVQPLPYVQVAGRYSYNRFWGRGVTGDFAETHLLLVESRLALHPKLQLIGSYQRDTDGNASVLNARLAWEFLPLSFVYVVVTDTRTAYAAPDAPPSELKIVAKVTYTWRP